LITCGDTNPLFTASPDVDTAVVLKLIDSISRCKEPEIAGLVMVE
jgi:hypothetical protein